MRFGLGERGLIGGFLQRPAKGEVERDGKGKRSAVMGAPYQNGLIADGRMSGINRQ